MVRGLFRVQGLWSTVRDVGFRIKSKGVRGQGIGLRVQCLEVGVKGLGFKF